MEQNTTPVFVTIIVVVLIFAGAFFFAFDRMATISSDLTELKGKVAALTQTGSGPAVVTPQPGTPTSTPSTPPPPAGGESTSTSVTVPAAIIFQVTSSDPLASQSRLTVTVESAKRDIDGRVTLGVKVFNGEAGVPAAIEPRALFELLNLEGENLKASGISGTFASIPSKGAATGSVMFQTDPTRKTVILQINLPELRFYEFDFEYKTYKQAEVG